MKYYFFGALFFVLSACDHIVLDNDELIIHSAKEIESGVRKYEYSIKDGSDIGWVLKTNKKFSVGDTLIFIKVDKD